MRVVFVDIDEQKALFETDATVALPNVGDIVSHVDARLYTVVQRAYIIEDAKAAIRLVDIKAAKKFEVTLQIGLKLVTAKEAT